MKRARANQQARTMDKSSTMLNLPLHILMEIISRLPIKTVMSIRCVCNSLLSLVSDYHFQILHSTKATTELFFTHTHKSRNSSTTLYIPEYVYEDDSDLTHVDANYNVVFHLPYVALSLVNSCCGLLCYKGPSYNMFVVVCNPFTLEYIRFPCPAKSILRVCYGLGFSPKDNRFKLLRIMYCYNVHSLYDHIVVGEIFTFGEGVSSWKRVANRPGANLLSLVIFHEGVLHWYCADSNAIVTFDFDTELFGELETPPHMRDMSNNGRRSLDMGVFENCLYTTACVGGYVDVWALKEYALGSWVKIFSIRKDKRCLSTCYEPVHYLQDGKVLMLKDVDGLVCFNPDTETVKNVGGMYGHNDAVLIRPSLASLKILLGDNVQVLRVKPWDRIKAATILLSWTSSVSPKSVIMERKQKQARMMDQLSTMECQQKQARLMDKSSTMANLPSCILMEIISRLPIKTVVAIRCVCKSLLDIVSDSCFQILHSTRAPTEVMFIGYRKSSKILSIAEYVFLGDSVTAVSAKSNVVFGLPDFSVPSESSFNLGATGSEAHLVNSCCGLVCFSGPPRNKFVVVCNPITREYITFPSPAWMDKTVKKEGICYGLGFIPKDNNFKLLRLMYRREVVGRRYVDKKHRIVGEIFTFGERFPSWKRVANCPVANLQSLGNEKIIFHEGVLHWDCTFRDGVIVTFDFDTELFGELVTPPCMADMSRSKVGSSLAVGVFENSLCISGRVGDCVDVWALKEYGQGAWIKIFSIQRDVNRFDECYEPFTYLQNGEVLMFKKFSDIIVCFNLHTRSVREVRGTCSRNGTTSITPSLVSLKVLLGDSKSVHNVKPWDRTKASTIPRVWRSSLKEDVIPAILESQQDGAGRSTGQSSSETQTR